MPVPATKRRILVVDDNLDAAVSLSRLIALLGHDVNVARDGNAALFIARSVRPDFVLLDIGLPGSDGFQVAEALGAGLSALKIITVLGRRGEQGSRALAGAESTTAEAGGRAFPRKPARKGYSFGCCAGPRPGERRELWRSTTSTSLRHSSSRPSRSLSASTELRIGPRMLRNSCAIMRQNLRVRSSVASCRFCRLRSLTGTSSDRRRGHDQRGDVFVVGAAQAHLGLRAFAISRTRAEQRCEALVVTVTRAAAQRRSDQALARRPEKGGHTLVRIADVALSVDDDHALLHAVDRRLVEALRGIEHHHLLAADDQRVDRAAADRVDRGSGLFVLFVLFVAFGDEERGELVARADERDAHLALPAARRAQRADLGLAGCG